MLVTGGKESFSLFSTSFYIFVYGKLKGRGKNVEFAM